LVAAAVILAPYGVVYFAAAWALRIEEARSLLKRFSG
jgi:hypothetical protein